MASAFNIKPEETSPDSNIQKFMAEYGELTKKYGVDFATYPMFVPDEKDRGSFKIICQTIPIDVAQMQKETSKKGFWGK